MLCPKCSREISSEKNHCDFCGFTFQTPKSESYSMPMGAVPAYPAPAYEPAAPVQPAQPIPPAQPAAPAYEAPRSAYTAPYAQTPFQAPSYSQSYAPQTPAYAAPAYTPRPAPMMESQDNLSVGQYIGMMLLGLVPLVGLIFYIIWACRKKGNPNRRRFAAAALILKAVGLMFLLGAGFIAISYYTPLFFYIFR